MEKTTGEKLKELRTSQDITLKDLAEATGLSPGHLSQFERGLGTLSIHSLGRVASALGVQLSYFLETERGASHSELLTRSYSFDLVMMPDSHILYNRLGNDLPECQLEPILVTILPNSRHENAYPKPHAGEEFVYVLEGILTVLYNDEVYTLNPGDSMHYQSTNPHEWINHTPHIVKMVTVNTPRILPI